MSSPVDNAGDGDQQGLLNEVYMAQTDDRIIGIIVSDTKI